jgi:hypothetical protein
VDHQQQHQQQHQLRQVQERVWPLAMLLLLRPALVLEVPLVHHLLLPAEVLVVHQPRQPLLIRLHPSNS